MTLALVLVLSGDEARDAARADGVIGSDEDLPNDVYVPDLDETATIEVAGAAAAVVDCEAGCRDVDVDVDDLLTGTVTPFNDAAAVFAVTIEAGVVTEIREIYLP